MPKHLLAALVCAVSLLSLRAAPPVLPEENCAQLRLPAVPLVTHDPYFSVWSFTDRPNDSWPVHWTGAVNALCGIVRVDGQPYSFLGQPRTPGITPAQTQAVRVSATRTQYVLQAGPVEITLTFTSPLLIDDLDILSRPASYLHLSARATDGEKHQVQLYLDATAEWAVHEPNQPVIWEKIPGGNTADILAIGTTEQKILGRRGDNVRIDWGRFLLASPQNQRAASFLGDVDAARRHFAEQGKLPDSEPAAARPANDRWPGLAFAFDLQTVKNTPADRLLLLAYDDAFSIQYFQQNLRPWWNREGKFSSADLVQMALQDYPALAKRCAQMDARIAQDALRAGGRKYADLCIAAYRQAISAHKAVAGPKGEFFFFSKENFSNGSIGTIDVTYPSFPLFATYNPQLARGLLDFIFDYAESGRWEKPFAPHDVGTYPLANGQTYGGDMPIEESANMLVMAALISRLEGNSSYLQAHRKTLCRWADYLVQNGLDPANQLCTDDFAGHFARNSNLSLKAIVGLGAFAQELRQAGFSSEADRYARIAKLYAQVWPEMARDGDHYGLVFGAANTWSLKYNIVWDKILGLELFDPAIVQSELAFYRTKINPYGIPLDNRSDYTKSDWVLWTAVLADHRTDFDALVDPIWKYVNETPSRVPVSDWHWTTSGKERGFRARSVVGGYSLKILADRLQKTAR